MSDFQSTLEKIARNSLYATGVNAKMVLYSFTVFARYLQPGGILELGPAEGLMTDLLVQTGQDLTLVDGAETFCKDLAARFPQADVHHALFEAFETDMRFANIILGHVLEHVEEPVTVLNHIKRFLAPGGRILCAVPNARSIHRQAGVIMGHLGFEEDMSELDIHHGHMRVYNPETLRREFHLAGLEVEVFGGYWLKPLAQGQIETNWTDEMVAAFMKLGERYPDIAAEIYVVARLPEAGRP